MALPLQAVFSLAASLQDNVHVSHVRLFETLGIVALQAPLSMEFFWSGLPCPPSGDLPGPGIEPVSLVSPALAGGFFTTSAKMGHQFLKLL